MQPACSLHVDRLPVVDAVQPSANALQAIDIRGLPIDLLLINIHDHMHFGSYLRIEFETFQFWILCKIKIENNEFPISVQ